MSAKKLKPLTKARVRRLLKYLPEVGQFLWRVDRGPSAKAGQVAGFAGVDGTWRVWIEGRIISAHTLAWLYVTGEMPQGLLTFKNGIKDDFRWENIALLKGYVGPPTLEQIEANCDVVGECWHWNGAKSHGSPHMRYNGKVIQVRRYIFTELLGKVPQHPYITMTCDHLDCVNPEHIASMTRQQLQRRSAERTRYGDDPVRNAKLAEVKSRQSPYSEELVRKVREMDGTAKAIARELGLNHSTVNRWRNHRSRKEVAVNPWSGLLNAA